MMEELHNIVLVALVVLAAWLVFKVVKKIVIAALIVLIITAVALFVYIRFF
jgi:hypothetical protein